MSKRKIILTFFIFAIVFCFTAVEASFADATDELVQADAYYNNKDYSQAETIYKNVKTYYPGTEEAFKSYRKLITLYIATYNQSQEQSTFQELVSTYPDDIHTARAIHGIGSACRKLGKCHKAKEYYQYVVDHFSGSKYLIWSGKNYVSCAIWAQKDLIKMELRLGNETPAQEGILELCSDFSGHKDLPIALRGLADQYIKLKNYGTALVLYGYILDKYPDDADAIHCQKGVVYCNIWIHDDPNDPNTKEAFDKLKEDFNKHPEFANGILRIGQEYYYKAMELNEQNLGNKATGYFSKAIVICKPILTRISVSLRANYLTAHCYRELGNLEKAAEHYEHIVKKWSKNKNKYVKNYVIQSLKYIYVLNIKNGNDAEVLEKLDRLASDFEDHPYLHKSLFEVGEQYYEQALNSAEQNPNSSNNYLSNAIAAWKKIIQGKSVSVDRMASSHYFTGICYYKLGDYSKAAEHYAKVVEVCPDYDLAWNAQFMVGKCNSKLTEAGGISQAEGDAKTKAAYEQLLTKYPDCKFAGIAGKWLKK